MAEFNKEEKKVIREMVDHYENIDEMRAEVKERVDELFETQMFDLQ